jgi:hypothetical protein
MIDGDVTAKAETVQSDRSIAAILDFIVLIMICENVT